MRRFGGTFLNLAHAVATSPDGSTVFVAGTGYLRWPDYDFVTIAYDARTGAPRWVDRYDGPAGAEDYVDSLVVSPNGSAVFVSGTSYGRGSDDVATIAYRASTGARMWVSRQGPPGVQDYARGLAVSPDGSRVFVTGTTEHVATRGDAVTVAYRASTGRALWIESIPGPRRQRRLRAVAGGEPRRRDGLRVRLELRRRRSDDPHPARLRCLHRRRPVDERRHRIAPVHGGVAAHDRLESRWVLAVRRRHGPGAGTGTDFGTVAYDVGSGARLWARRYEGVPRGYDYANALVVSPDGSTVFVTGGSPSGGSTGAFGTVAYGARTGATVWSRRYSGPVDGYASSSAIAVTTDGTRVYVTGESVGRGTAGDYATVAYRARTGEKVWSARYDGPTSDWDLALAVAVSPNGARVFVTGGSERGADEFFVTVAYRG